MTTSAHTPHRRISLYAPSEFPKIYLKNRRGGFQNRPPNSRKFNFNAVRAAAHGGPRISGIFRKMSNSQRTVDQNGCGFAAYLIHGRVLNPPLQRVTENFWEFEIRPTNFRGISYTPRRAAIFPPLYSKCRTGAFSCPAFLCKVEIIKNI